MIQLTLKDRIIIVFYGWLDNLLERIGLIRLSTYNFMDKWHQETINDLANYLNNIESGLADRITGLVLYPPGDEEE